MFVRPQKWAHGNGRVKRGCHVKYELSSPPRTPSKCSLKYISAVCLLFLLTKVIFSKEATPTHFKFFLMRQPHFCHFWTFLLVKLKPVFSYSQLLLASPREIRVLIFQVFLVIQMSTDVPKSKNSKKKRAKSDFFGRQNGSFAHFCPTFFTLVSRWLGPRPYQLDVGSWDTQGTYPPPYSSNITDCNTSILTFFLTHAVKIKFYIFQL